MNRRELYEKELAELRERYEKASNADRKIIMAQGKLKLWAYEAYMKKSDDTFVKRVQKELGY